MEKNFSQAFDSCPVQEVCNEKYPVAQFKTLMRMCFVGTGYEKKDFYFSWKHLIRLFEVTFLQANVILNINEPCSLF